MADFSFLNEFFTGGLRKQKAQADEAAANTALLNAKVAEFERQSQAEQDARRVLQQLGQGGGLLTRDVRVPGTPDQAVNVPSAPVPGPTPSPQTIDTYALSAGRPNLVPPPGTDPGVGQAVIPGTPDTTRRVSVPTDDAIERVLATGDPNVIQLLLPTLNARRTQEVASVSRFQPVQLKDGTLVSFDQRGGGFQVLRPGSADPIVAKNEVELAQLLTPSGGDVLETLGKVKAAGATPSKLSPDAMRIISRTGLMPDGTAAPPDLIAKARDFEEKGVQQQERVARAVTGARIEERQRAPIGDDAANFADQSGARPSADLPRSDVFKRYVRVTPDERRFLMGYAQIGSLLQVDSVKDLFPSDKARVNQLYIRAVREGIPVPGLISTQDIQRLQPLLAKYDNIVAFGTQLARVAGETGNVATKDVDRVTRNFQEATTFVRLRAAADEFRRIMTSGRGVIFKRQGQGDPSSLSNDELLREILTKMGKGEQ